MKYLSKIKQASAPLVDHWGLWLALLASMLMGVTVWVIWDPLFKNHEEIRNIGLFVIPILGAPLLIWRAILASKNTSISNRNSINDMFSRAIEQLGTEYPDGRPNIEVRIGAIYALERLVQINSEYHQTIMAILASYIVKNAANIRDHSTKEITISYSIPRDAQAAFAVIERRDKTRDSYQLDLSGANWRQLDLSHKNFTEMNLTDTHLQGARLSEAVLQGAQLIGADLQDAALGGANLQGADLTRAHLQSACLNMANLQDAVLVQANLQGADLMFSDLQGANLFWANLQGTYLLNALNLTCEQLQEAINWELAICDKELACGASIPDCNK